MSFVVFRTVSTNFLEENNTPTMNHVKKQFIFMTKKGTVEYAQLLNLSVSNAQSRVYSTPVEVKLIGTPWIGNGMIELTEKQIEFLTEEYK